MASGHLGLEAHRVGIAVEDCPVSGGANGGAIHGRRLGRASSHYRRKEAAAAS
eukprot:COSAG01_NODE_55009_length_328_cov_0.711790_1_plen_52_part_10